MKKKRFTKEASPKARTKINKKKFNGIKRNITGYRNDIIEVFYNPEALKEILTQESLLTHSTNKYLIKEAFDTLMQDYFDLINSKIAELLEKAREYILDSFQKGGARVMNNKGDQVKNDGPDNTDEVDDQVEKQQTYYNNLSQDQSDKINQIISEGIEEGASPKETAEVINNTIKKMTFGRALNISRTELVKSHNAGQIQVMKEAGIEFYNYITRNDKKVSKICKHNQGPKGREKKYKVGEAGTSDNPLPVINSHPNCRCTTVIWTKS